MFDPELDQPPRTMQSPLRLVRVYDRLAGVFVSREPLYLGSHWRQGRSFPCVRKLLRECPWCRSTARREHAYLGVLVKTAPGHYYRAVIEIPPATVAQALADSDQEDLWGLAFQASRRHKKAPLSLVVSDERCPGIENQAQTTSFDILRTLARVYGLPDPLEASAKESWLLQVQLRITHADYSPAKHGPLED
jgi:hypothetical protein